MRGPGRFDSAELLKPQSRADALEQTSATAEKDRNDVQLDLIDKPGDEVLVDRIGTASDDHVLAAGCLPRLLQCRFDPIGDEG